MVSELSTPDNEGDPEHHTGLWRLMAQFHLAASAADKEPLTIICERFQFRPDDAKDREKIELISKEYEGLVKFFCKQNPTVKLVLQNSAQACGKTAFWGDSAVGNGKLRTCGMWVPNMVHGMDAVRHYLYHITFGLHDNRYVFALKKENK